MFKLVTVAVAAGLFSVAAYAAPEATMQTTIPQSAITVTDWYKQNVYDPNNNKIGEVMDVLVDKSGKIHTLIVGVGGFLGAGEKDVAVPFELGRGDHERQKDAPGHEHDQGQPQERAGVQIRQQHNHLGPGQQKIGCRPVKKPGLAPGFFVFGEAPLCRPQLA